MNQNKARQRAKALLELGGLWPTPQGEAGMQDPEAVEAFRDYIAQELEQLDGPALLAVLALVSMLASTEDNGPTAEDLGPFADLVEGWG